MHKRKHASWWPPLFGLAMLASFIFIKLMDPTQVDKALDDLSRRWIGRALANYYSWHGLQTAQVAVGLFEDSFKKDISRQPPTLDRYAQIIQRLIGFRVREIVIDMDMRLGSADKEATEALVTALNDARIAKIPVIIPYMPEDDASCLDEAGNVATISVQCAAAARGAVQFIADDATSYYPLFVRYEDDGEVMVPSLAWIAYLLSPGSIPPKSDDASRDPLNDDIFPVWRRPLSDNGYVFCGFAVRQLLPDVVVPGASSCPSTASAAKRETQDNISIESLVKGKIIFIGQAGRGNKDWIETPFGVDQPGVMLHAAVTDNLFVFGAGGYWVNRDGVLLSFGKLQLRASEALCVLLYFFQLFVIFLGRCVAKFRLTRLADEWMEILATLTSVVISCCMLLLCRPPLGLLNGSVAVISTCFILLAATFVEKRLKQLVKGRHA